VQNGNGKRSDSDQYLNLELRDTDPVPRIPDDEEPTQPELTIGNDPLSYLLKDILKELKDLKKTLPNIESALIELSATVASHHASVIQHSEMIGRKQAELERRQNNYRQDLEIVKQKLHSVDPFGNAE
jgi:hypothetical protein